MSARRRTGRFTHAGHELVYDVYGEEGPLVVYLHGLLLDSEANRPLAEELAALGCRVVLLDLLGHGRSDKPQRATDYRMDAYAEQVVALLDALGEESAVLGGMSLGANVSLITAAEHPERVSGLVIEMPVLEWAVPSAALLFVPMLLLVHYGRPLANLMAGAMRHAPSTPFTMVNSVAHGASLPPDTMASILHGILVGPIGPTLEQRQAIEAPALVLGHRHDRLHPFDDARNLASQLPNATLVEAQSPLELRRRPDRLMRTIAEFFEAQSLPGPQSPSNQAGSPGESRRAAADHR